MELALAFSLTGEKKIPLSCLCGKKEQAASLPANHLHIKMSSLTLHSCLNKKRARLIQKVNDRAIDYGK